MTAELALRAEGLGKRYGSNWALRDCTLEVPRGSVTALLGPNGAGKTTLLSMAIGLTRPTAGRLEVLGLSPIPDQAELLPRVGFVAQEHPLHRRFTIADTLELGRRLNPTSWDAELAASRIERLGLPPRRPIAKLSGGQQAQVALTLALAKRPDLLLLDEPVAALDPLARREFLSAVMEAVADSGMTVILSSHIIADLERVCDHLVILSRAEPLLDGPIDEIVAAHRLLTGPRTDPATVARVHTVIEERHTERQTSLVVRANGHVYDPSWEQHPLGLEEIALAYLGHGRAPAERVLEEAIR
jgi:ABC-2 type transport system ATP-binding protein